MEYIKADQVEPSIQQAFFQQKLPNNISQEDINAYGYFIKEETIQAFFMLVPLESDGVQLKHLYIKEKLAPVYILAIIEICIQLVKKNQLQHIYIYSEQDVLDQLVQQLQFELCTVSPSNQQSQGKWWCLTVDKAATY